MCTSIICTAENFSNRLRGVRPGGEAVESMADGDVETIGEEGDEDVSLDALRLLVMDRPDGEVAGV